jgi:uncharacterized protein (TIGR03000 family)
MPYQYGQPTMSGYYDPQGYPLPTWSNVNGAIQPGATDRRGQGVYTDESPQQRRDGTNPDRPIGTTTPRDLSRPAGSQPMPQSQSAAEAPATIIVSLPANARLMVDGQPTQATSSDRTFVSPPLPPGKTFQYSFKAELDQNGKKVTTTRNVDVRAGETSRVALDFSDRGAQD